MNQQERTSSRNSPNLDLPILTLPGQRCSIACSLPSHSRGYSHAIDEFIHWYCSEPRLVLQQDSCDSVPHPPRVSPASTRHDQPQTSLPCGDSHTRPAESGRLNPELAAGIRRVKKVQKTRYPAWQWLTAEEARALWQLPSAETLKGKRDRAILATLLGCRLRRWELGRARLRTSTASRGALGDRQPGR